MKKNKSNQIGCGYCALEKTCKDRNPLINKARAGCKRFNHWENVKNEEMKQNN